MGFLKLFSRPATLNLVRLPSGSFTVDPAGKVLASTLPNTFPEAWAEAIGQQVLQVLRKAQNAEMPLREVMVEYSSLKLTARGLRGGALIFLTPQGIGRR